MFEQKRFHVIVKAQIFSVFPMHGNFNFGQPDHYWAVLKILGSASWTYAQSG